MTAQGFLRRDGLAVYQLTHSLASWSTCSWFAIGHLHHLHILGHLCYNLRRHQTCDFHNHATTAPAELGGEIHKVSRYRARTQVPPQAEVACLRKWHDLVPSGRGALGTPKRSCDSLGASGYLMIIQIMIPLLLLIIIIIVVIIITIIT